MMDRSLRDRLSKNEKRLSIEEKKRKEKDEKFIRDWVSTARDHATAVAAIVLAGQPKFDEPLIKAWGRTLRRYRINYNSSRGLAEQFRAAEQLRPLIMQGKKQSARFTEIFAAAPVWLLQFTGVAMDARVLKFDLPDISGRLPWGTDGYEDAKGWARLPSGTLTAGDPITDYWQQYRLVYLCKMTVGDPVQAFRDRFSGDKTEEIPSTGNPLIDELNRNHSLFSEIDATPEREWSPREKRHIRRVGERISHLTAEDQKRKH